MTGNVIFEIDALLCVMLSKAKKNIFFMGNKFLPHNLYDYKHLVAQTGVIITKSNCISNFSALTLYSDRWFANVFIPLPFFILRMK